MQLTQCQQNARKVFFDFIRHPDQQCMVLQGYAGTGKTTLVTYLVEELEKIHKLKSIVKTGKQKEWEPVFTATTNKAAEALESATGHETSTIHRLLSLSVITDYTTGAKRLVRKRDAPKHADKLIFVDEASYIDDELLVKILINTKDCKVVFMGDPTQLTPVGSTTTPVFDRKSWPTAELVQVVRQEADNPIQAITAGLREYIKGGPFPKCVPDGEFIIHKPRHEFDDAVLKEFTRKDWKSTDSRLLAWRNATVLRYNNALYKHCLGRPDFAVGDMVINNRYVKGRKDNGSMKTDALVTITRIHDGISHGIEGKIVDTDKGTGFFLPPSKQVYDEEYERAIQDKNAEKARDIEDYWIDLRAAYCCTVNKSQGSTYDKAFIDLEDIGLCSDPNQMARMLYVAISRAKTQVILTGDIK